MQTLRALISGLLALMACATHWTAPRDAELNRAPLAVCEAAADEAGNPSSIPTTEESRPSVPQLTLEDREFEAACSGLSRGLATGCASPLINFLQRNRDRATAVTQHLPLHSLQNLHVQLQI